MSFRHGGRRRDAGYSMIELLFVVGIIGVMVGVAVPNIVEYVRTSKIRAAANEVSTAVNTARGNAIMKNVNLGVVFVILSSNTYRWVIEDDQTGPPFSTVQKNLSVLLADSSQVGTLQTLPQGVTFATTGATDKGIRFDRLGIPCEPSVDTDCYALDSGYSAIAATSDEAVITVYQAETGYTRKIHVAAGGRTVITYN